MSKWFLIYHNYDTFLYNIQTGIVSLYLPSIQIAYAEDEYLFYHETSECSPLFSQCIFTTSGAFWGLMDKQHIFLLECHFFSQLCWMVWAVLVLLNGLSFSGLMVLEYWCSYWIGTYANSKLLFTLFLWCINIYLCILSLVFVTGLLTGLNTLWFKW